MWGLVADPSALLGTALICSIGSVSVCGVGVGVRFGWAPTRRCWGPVASQVVSKSKLNGGRRRLSWVVRRQRRDADEGVERWKVPRMGPLCLESVRAIHQPPERFRVSPSCYPVGTSFPGSARAGRRYILSGACSFTVGASVWELHVGDIADIPEGGYEFRVLGSGPVEFVSVWELPSEFWDKASVAEPSAAADGAIP